MRKINIVKKKLLSISLKRTPAHAGVLSKSCGANQRQSIVTRPGPPFVTFSACRLCLSAAPLRACEGR